MMEKDYLVLLVSGGMFGMWFSIVNSLICAASLISCNNVLVGMCFLMLQVDSVKVKINLGVV